MIRWLEDAELQIVSYCFIIDRSSMTLLVTNLCISIKFFFCVVATAFYVIMLLALEQATNEQKLVRNKPARGTSTPCAGLPTNQI